MILQKWNSKKHIYEKFDSPAEFTLLYSHSMLTRVDCAECGKRTPYGETYTSRLIHDNDWWGFPVCGDCYEKELKEPS